MNATGQTMVTAIETILGDSGALLSRPNTCRGRLQRIALSLLLEHEENGEIPTNGRFIFYELEGRGLVFKVPKGKRRGTTQRPGPMELGEATTHLREVGLVPWSWIVDETRTLWQWHYADSVAQYVRDQLEYACLNPWEADPPLLLVESRSLGGVLKHHVSKYLVPIAATNGQVGGFLHTDVIPILRNNDRPVLYLGDLDLQGHQIEANTRSVLERETSRFLDWTRIALTEDQVQERGLTPIFKTDTRYKPAKHFEAWECEALGQRTIINMVTAALDSLLPEPLGDVQARATQQKSEIRDLLAEWEDAA